LRAPRGGATAGTPIAAAARLMDAEHVKRLPVVDRTGRLVGVVSRRDLLKVHRRTDQEIASDIETDVVGPLLAREPGKVTVAVIHGTVTLAGQVGRRSTAEAADRMAGQVAGVVAVNSSLEYDYDDGYASFPPIGIAAT
jgi:predicted transcriptional regulator